MSDAQEKQEPLSEEQRSRVEAALLSAIQEHRPILERFHAESDRGAILVAASFLDSTLERLLRAAFVKEAAGLFNQLFAFEGPLGTFSARINLAFAIGLIHEKTAEHLHRVRRIRNMCAHSPETVDFNTDSVRDLTAAMWPVDAFIPAEIREGGAQGLTRARFLFNAVMLYAQLLLILRDADITTRQQLWLAHLMGKEAGKARVEHARTEMEHARAEINEERTRIEELRRQINEGLEAYAKANGISFEEARAKLDALVDRQLRDEKKQLVVDAQLRVEREVVGGKLNAQSGDGTATPG